MDTDKNNGPRVDTEVEKDCKETDVDTGVTKRVRTPANKDIDNKNTLTKNINVAEASTGSYDHAGQSDSSPGTSPPRKKLISALKEKLKDDEKASRMKLAHEIAMDGDFQIPDSSDSAVPLAHDKSPEANKKRMEKAVKDVVRKAFWDCIRANIESNPPRYDHAFILLQEIKDIMLSLLPANRVTSFHKRILEYMDMKLFQQQAQNDTLDVKAIAAFVVDMMSSICAPVRDEQVAALRSIEDIVDMFKEIHKVLDLMKIDLANHAIKSVRPHIQQQQFEYERSQFAQLVQKSSDGLKKTRTWISMTYQEICNDLDKIKDAPSFNSPDDKNKFEEKKKAALSPLALLKTAFTKLLLPEWKTENLPETLQMDHKRLETLRAKVEQLVLVSSIMITSCGVVGQPLASHQQFLNKLKSILMTLTTPDSDQTMKDKLDGISIQCWKEVVDYANGKGPEFERCISAEKESVLKNKITALESSHSHPVYGVLYKRTIEYLRVTADTVSNHTSTIPPNISTPPSGVSFVATELIETALQYAKLINLNQTIYGPFYVPILREILVLSKSNPNSPREESKNLTNGESEQNATRKKLNMGTEAKASSPSESGEQKGKYKVTGSLADLD